MKCKVTYYSQIIHSKLNSLLILWNAAWDAGDAARDAAWDAAWDEKWQEIELLLTKYL